MYLHRQHRRSQASKKKSKPVPLPSPLSEAEHTPLCEDKEGDKKEDKEDDNVEEEEEQCSTITQHVSSGNCIPTKLNTAATTTTPPLLHCVEEEHGHDEIEHRGCTNTEDHTRTSECGSIVSHSEETLEVKQHLHEEESTRAHFPSEQGGLLKASEVCEVTSDSSQSEYASVLLSSTVASHTSSEAVAVCPRRGSVHATVHELEQLIVDEGEVFAMPGMIALPGIAKQQYENQQQQKEKEDRQEEEEVEQQLEKQLAVEGNYICSDTTEVRVDQIELQQGRGSDFVTQPGGDILGQSIDNWKPFDIMDTPNVNTLVVTGTGDKPHTLSTLQSFDESNEASPFLKSLNKLVRVLYEFLQTEIKFSIDVNSLKTVMSEIKYSTLNSARQFVSTVSYVGIVVSTESIKITSNLLVRLFQESKVSPSIDQKGNVVSYTDVSECFECCQDNCVAVFNGLERCAPFFPLYASFIINHDGLSNAYRESVANDEEFQQYMSSVEILVGEGLLSLLIKPVQRLPRYVLLCREIHASISKSLSLLDESDPYYEQMNDLFNSSKHVLESMSGFTAKCNEAVRLHQDNLRMHSLQLSFEESGSDDLIEGFVSNKRRIIREGQLLRHHKHVGMRFHEFQIFSDVMLSSAAVGSSLKLEHVMMLNTDSDTICFPIPTMFDSTDSTWFFICSKKILFCSAETVNKRDKWVKDLQQCLIVNKADSDLYLMKKQIALVNAIISQINHLWKETQQLADVLSAEDISDERDSSMDPVHLQVSWWRLLGILSNLEGDDHASSESLRRVIDMHAHEVVNRILRSAMLVNTDTGEAVTHPRPPAAQSKLTSLLLNDAPHYLIASGFFYEATNYGPGSSLSDGVRPLIMRLFLLSDVLIAMYFDTVGDPLRYAFHINIEDIQCNDYRTDVGPTAIQLIDTSVKVTTRRFSLFGGNSEKKSRERIIFTPTMEMKFDWLTLIMQAYECNRSLPRGSSWKGRKFEGLKINQIPFPLHRIGALSSTTPWEYEKRINNHSDS